MQLGLAAWHRFMASGDAELLAELKREAAELEAINSGTADTISAAQPKTIQ